MGLEELLAEFPPPPEDTEGPRNQERGLYTPSLERDSCGVGFVAHIKGEATHKVKQCVKFLVSNKNAKLARTGGARAVA